MGGGLSGEWAGIVRLAIFSVLQSTLTEELMAKKSGKGPRVTIKMSSSESPYRFTTSKNKRNNPQRLQLKRYDPVVRRHVLFKEEK